MNRVYNLSEVCRKLNERGDYSGGVQYLHKLVKQGVIPHDGEGRKKLYDIDEVAQALENKKTMFHTKTGLETIPPPEDGQTPEEYHEEVVAKLGSNPSLMDSKTFLTIYQGKIAQQKYDIEAKKLVYRDEVEQKAFKVARVIRDQLLTLPERLSGEVASSTDPKEIKEIMYKEINEVLTFLHEGEALYE